MPGGIYGVSKYALHGLTVNLASELGGRDINVNAIAPGLVDNESGYVVAAEGLAVPRRARRGDPGQDRPVHPRTSSARSCCCARGPATGSPARRSSSTAAGSLACSRPCRRGEARIPTGCVADHELDSAELEDLDLVAPGV